MPVTIKVNGVANSLVHKGSGGVSIATIPDVCKTPAPGGPVPMPYPNISMASTLVKGSTTVKADAGMMIATKGSEFSMSNGDEAGVAGGVVSSTFMKESSWILYSFDVKIDGANACRLTDKKFHNHQNTVNLGGVLQIPVVPMGGGVQVKVPVLEGEVLEVTWLGGLDITRDKIKVNAPHWSAGAAVQEENLPDKQRYPTGSQKPAVYALGDFAADAKLRVKIKITRSEEQPAQGTLSGRLGTLALTGPCPTGVGTHEVEITLGDQVDAVRHVEGDVLWTLSTAASVCPLRNKTRLELFVVLDDPIATVFTDGVWAEVLRFLFKKARVGQLKTADDIAAAITRFCHTRHGVTYDTQRGASHFGAGNYGTPMFELTAYMAKDGDAGNVVNCYDQAAAIQSLAAAMGVDLDWIYLDPYGFIKPTNLVGVGLCNNPFYMSNGSRALIEWDSPKREGFGNHAFARLGGILDACAGPHTGNESLREYAESAIDAKRTIASWADPAWPTEDDYYDEIEAQPNPQPGVTGVN